MRGSTPQKAVSHPSLSAHLNCSSHFLEASGRRVQRRCTCTSQQKPRDLMSSMGGLGLRSADGTYPPPTGVKGRHGEWTEHHSAQKTGPESAPTVILRSSKKAVRPGQKQFLLGCCRKLEPGREARRLCSVQGRSQDPRRFKEKCTCQSSGKLPRNSAHPGPASAVHREHRTT